MAIELREGEEQEVLDYKFTVLYELVEDLTPKKLLLLLFSYKNNRWDEYCGLKLTAMLATT